MVAEPQEGAKEIPREPAERGGGAHDFWRASAARMRQKRLDPTGARCFRTYVEISISRRPTARQTGVALTSSIGQQLSGR